jgi:UDP-glucuronate 4-epimerase
MLEDFATLRTFYGDGFDAVYHFAAQAGVRYSLARLDVLGLWGQCEGPVSRDGQGRPSLDALCRLEKGNEEMAHAYSHLLKIPITMLRLFTVYGPWGRPDMALFKFAAALFEGRPIDIYNHAKMSRDFTYIDDLVEGMLRLLNHAPQLPEVRAPPLAEDSLSPVAPWRVVNIGAARPVALMDFVTAIEAATGIRARCNFMAMQQGDMPVTFADTSLLLALTGFAPKTQLKEGVKAFIAWYRDYFGA